MTAFLEFFGRDKRTAASRATRGGMAGVMVCAMVCVLTGLVTGCSSLSLTNTSPKVDYFVPVSYTHLTLPTIYSV